MQHRGSVAMFCQTQPNVKTKQKQGDSEHKQPLPIKCPEQTLQPLLETSSRKWRLSTPVIPAFSCSVTYGHVTDPAPCPSLLRYVWSRHGPGPLPISAPLRMVSSRTRPPAHLCSVTYGLVTDPGPGPSLLRYVWSRHRPGPRPISGLVQDRPHRKCSYALCIQSYYVLLVCTVGVPFVDYINGFSSRFFSFSFFNQFLAFCVIERPIEMFLVEQAPNTSGRIACNVNHYP